MPKEDLAHISRDTVRLILRDTAHLIAALERIENRLRASLKPQTDTRKGEKDGRD